ncbi:MAG: pentapeptide repeat-containing protein [Candidatus Accumulibacter phosphatis]|uniref:pentapeptide repeat-containing protein n=1 Tax=Candidatus Accumulibacter phosphatis TaxID=327160 RepID=UPI001A36CAA5|nr:pentapeptide repeat-containing protein [Candidatus Accumulibacter phosphatis]
MSVINPHDGTASSPSLAQDTRVVATDAAQTVQSPIADGSALTPAERQPATCVDLEARLQRLEEGTDVEFIRREVRLIPALVNLWRYFRPGSGADDQRSRAALTAFLWRLFSPGSAAAAGGLVMIGLTASQVLLISQQNQKLDQQTYLAEASRRGGLIAEFAALSEKVGGERAQSLKRGDGVAWKRFKVEGSHFRLEEATLARLSAFTRSAKAYHYLDLEAGADAVDGKDIGARLGRWLDSLVSSGGAAVPSPRMISMPLSPERGQVLSFLSTNAVDLSESTSWGLDFSQADLRSIQLVATKGTTLNLARADLSGATLVAVDLAAGNLRGAVFKDACWQEGDISRAKFKGADLRGAHLDEVALPTADELAEVKLDAATNLAGSYSFFPKWLEGARESLPVDSRPHLDRYTETVELRTFVMHDFEGKAAAPEERRIYVLASRDRSPSPIACTYLPGP